jgi:hypothetical protein
MTPAREALLSTIRALMEMTEARGCTRAEAAIASAKARQLMDKHGISLKEFLVSARITAVSPSGEPRQEPSRRHPAYEYCSNAFVNEASGARRRTWTWEPFRRAGRIFAGYAAVGFVIWAIAAFDIAPSQQDRPYKYGRGVSNGDEPVIGDGVNPSYQKGQVRYRRNTFHDAKTEYFGSSNIRPVPDY